MKLHSSDNNRLCKWIVLFNWTKDWCCSFIPNHPTVSRIKGSTVELILKLNLITFPFKRILRSGRKKKRNLCFISSQTYSCPTVLKGLQTKKNMLYLITTRNSELADHCLFITRTATYSCMFTLPCQGFLSARVSRLNVSYVFFF